MHNPQDRQQFDLWTQTGPKRTAVVGLSARCFGEARSRSRPSEDGAWNILEPFRLDELGTF